MTLRTLFAIIFLMIAIASSPIALAQDEKAKVRLQEISTANAVERGLHWLQWQQDRDGGWKLDSAQPNDIAATALALLPLLEATDHPAQPRAAVKKDVLVKGLKYLVNKQKADGGFNWGMYAHAIATWALCDGYRWSKDPQLKKPAQQAIDLIVRAQHGQGGWRYTPKTPGDLSVSAWHIAALKAGQRAGIEVPADTFKKASAFLDVVSLEGGNAYCYVPNGPPTASMTGAGLYCRHLLGWEKDHKALKQGALRLQQLSAQPRTLNAYHHHFATRAFLAIGGETWVPWEARIVTFLIERQERRGALEGSWPAQGDVYGDAGGRLMVTSLSLLALMQCGHLNPTAVSPRQLSPAEAAQRWADLRGDDFGKVRDAMEKLLGSPNEAVSLLVSAIKPAEVADAKKTDALIADLSATAFAKRNRANEQLKELGEAAIPSLRKALKANPEVELRRRVETLLELAANQAHSPERLRELRGVQILELTDTPEARAVLERLAKGARHIGVTDAADDALLRMRSR